MLKNHLHIFLIVSLFITSTSFAEDGPTTITLTTSNEFQFVDKDSSTFTIQSLSPAHQSIESLKNVDAIGIVYLGNISLVEDATPLSVLREISAQISRGLDLDFALIADSTTSQSLAPHELLLLYHPDIVITLGLTKVAESESYSLIGTYAMPSTPNLQASSQASPDEASAEE